MKRFTVVHTEWSKGWGGQEMRILAEARGLTERGHRVILATRPECRLREKASAVGLPVHVLPMRNAADLRAIAGLARLLSREHADVINTHSSIDSWVGGLAAKLTRTRLVRTRHLSTPWRRHPLNLVVKMPDAVITTGEALRRDLLAAHGFSSSHVVSIPTGVDLDFFVPLDRSQARQTLGLPHSAPVVAKVAVLRSFKRHDLLLDAVARLAPRHDLYLLCAGDGSARARLEARASELGIAERVRFLGHLEDVRPVLAAADVVVSASDSNEGVPQALAQALALGRAVVATDVGSVAELVRHEETGLLVAPADVAGLAAAVERLLLDPSLAAACGARGREHVAAQYSLTGMLDQTLALYERLLA